MAILIVNVNSNTYYGAMRYSKIPSETIRRLPMYLRALIFIEKNAKDYISSKSLSEFVHINPSQIRKDFSYFGAFGVKGTGYKVITLIEQIREILKIKGGQKAALIGAGKLGTAISLYSGFKTYGFDIAAIYDIDESKIGTTIGKVVVEDANDLSSLKEKGIRLAIVAVPAETAQATAAKLVEVGVNGILNLSPCYLDVPKEVKVITIDIAMELGILPYYM